MRLAQGLVLLLLVIAIGPLVVHANPGLLGADQSYVVLTGSMVPTFAPGDMIFNHDVRADDLQAGDVITFRSPQDRERLYTHRILSVEDGEFGTTFVTKGDANEDPDPAPVAPGQVIGRYSFHIPYAGYVKAFADTLAGFLLLFILPGSALVLHQVWTIVRIWEDWEKRKKAERDATTAPARAPGGASPVR